MPVIPVYSRALSFKLDQSRYLEVNNNTSGISSPKSPLIKDTYPTEKSPHGFSNNKDSANPQKITHNTL
ncbi:hypothetical protein TUM17377_22290 [Shewanella chilikensis]|nr:hypothetical protein TUM17377_22290 [Shewanella chilikensis]